MSIACQVMLLVIVAGAVRRQRPDAWRGLLIWAIGHLAAAIVIPLLHTVLGELTTDAKIDLLVVVHSVVMLVGASCTSLSHCSSPVASSGSPSRPRRS